MAMESVELPSRWGVRPSRNEVVIAGAVVQIGCTDPSSVKLVEQELWQREEKQLIDILPVCDEAESIMVGPVLYPSNGAVAEHGERNLKNQSGISDSHKLDGKNQQEVFHCHNRGVAARALNLSRGAEEPSGRVTYTIVREGLCRFIVQELTARGTSCTARISPVDMTKAEMEQAGQDPDFIALARQFKATAMELISALEQKQKTSRRTKVLLETISIHKLSDIFVASFEISFQEQLSMLNSVDLKVRLSKAIEYIDRHLQSIRVVKKILKAVEVQLSMSQSKFLLRPQMRAIKEKLGDNDDDDEDDMAALKTKIQSAGMPPDIWERAHRELRSLKMMKPQQPGYSSSLVYLEFLANLPWQKISEDHGLSLRAVKMHLDRDHYGLVKAKQQIIDCLAVHKLNPDIRFPVFCFVGLPGIGKTSLVASIAAALGRKFIHISLRGMKDEADIRGRWRAYMGSRPGRLIDGIKRVGVCNPVILLDDIDKIGSMSVETPAVVLLKVLDFKQNKAFNDRYLNVPFDLSKVIFMATANEVQSISPLLLKRMEVIELPGYTPEEKLKIAMQYLIPRVLDQHGLSSEFLQIPEGIVKLVTRRYTREAGVRNLEQNLAALARAVAVRLAEQDHATSLHKDMHQLSSSILESRLAEGAEVEMKVLPIDVDSQEISSTTRLHSPVVVDEDMLENVLGPPRFVDGEIADHVATPGVSVGLVWTEYGGEIQFVEATAMTGKGDLCLTGQLDDVIKESAQIALTWVRVMAADMKLALDEKTNLMESRDIHIHLSAGAVPKDGLSAGVALVTALVSLFSKRRVRADTAITGKMTLRGLILPVEGIKDKILAAHRYGIKRVILPEGNLKDLVEVPSAVLASLKIIFAKQMEDILEEAFEGGCPWR
ncbi:hypothetical protein Nepgr_028589 [Nepenthes gracilis]|uniref:Lon protease homolog n=1 Tax=Nepenthes gracilis TaxID=150966 RepID=A0AAD3Y4Q2_NEPGR|nr:hypothetical protein Nepgr_028589 [Nepenthes gracilis]